MARLVLIDLDGTLLTRTQDVPPSAQAACREAREAGHILAMCTGRSTPEIYPWLWDLGFSAVIGGSGAYVEVDGQVIRDERIDRADIESVNKVLSRNECLWVWQSSEAMHPSADYLSVFPGKDPDWVPYMRQIEPYLRSGIPDSASKCAFLAPRAGIFEAMSSQLDERFDIIGGSVGTADARVGEILKAQCHKLTGAHVLCGHLGISISDVVGIGDSPNDRELLAGVGTSIAMGNGSADVKAIASWVTSPVDEDGLARAFEYAGLITR